MLIHYIVTGDYNRYMDWVFVDTGVIYTVYGIAFAIPGISSIKIFKKYVKPFYQ